MKLSKTGVDINIKELINLGFKDYYPLDTYSYEDNDSFYLLVQESQLYIYINDSLVKTYDYDLSIVKTYIHTYKTFKNDVDEICGDHYGTPYLFIKFQSLIDIAENRLYEINKLLKHEIINFSCENLGYDISITSIINGVDIKVWLSLMGVIKVKRV